jgi:hypothetical protein
MEQQAQEISIMLLGFPAQVQPADDDKAHLQSLQGYVDAELQQGKPLDPKFARLALGHIQGHMQALNQKRDPALNQVRQQIAPLIDYLQKMAMMDQQQQPGNVIPGPGAQPPQPQQPQEPPTAKDLSSIQSDRIKDATAVANSLANLMKAGVSVSMPDVNKALIDMGLPPLTAVSEPAVIPPQPMSQSQPNVQAP